MRCHQKSTTINQIRLFYDIFCSSLIKMAKIVFNQAKVQ
jgi:hypothetical protein